MSLEAILTAIGERLPAGAEYKLGGPEAIAVHGAPPRVVADATSETIGPAHGNITGGAQYPRRFLARSCLVQFHVWCESMSACEVLAERIWNAVIQVAPGSFVPGTADWRGGAVTDLGVVYVFGVTFLIPISRLEERREIQTMPITGDIVPAA